MKLQKQIICLLLCLPGLFCLAQNKQVDSLKNVLSTTQSDSVKLYVNRKIGSILSQTSPVSGIPYFTEAAKLAKKLGKKKTEAQILNSLGGINYYLANYEEALSCAIKGEKLMEEVGDKDGLADCYNGIALIYGKNHQREMSMKYFKKSLALRQELNDTASIAQSLNNIAGYYEDQPDLDSALLYYSESLTYMKLASDKFGESMLLNNIGMIHAKKHNFSTAENYLLKSLALKKEIEDPIGQAEAAINLGDLYHGAKKYAEAEKYLTQALELSQQNDASELIRDCYQSLALNYKAKNDIPNAYKHLELFMQYKDSVSTEERTRAITEMNAKFDSEKKEQEIELLNKDKEKQAAIAEEETKRKNTILGSVAAVLALVIVFSVFMYNRFRITRRQKNIIEKQKVIVEQQRAETEHQKELIEEKQKEILDSINYAKRIQQALLASEELLNNNLKNYFVLFKPKDIVSGDFYWATEHNNKFYLAVCDSTGHGVPGAFMSLLNIGFLSESIKEKDITEVNEILNYARKRLITTISKEGQQDGFDGILLCLDKKTGSYTYSAAHNSPTLVSNSTLSNLSADKMPVGKGEKVDSFSKHTLSLHAGDTLYLYTDGFADQFGGPKGKKFKYKQLEDILLSVNNLPLNEQSAVLNQRFEEWKGDLEQVDDVLIIGIKN